MTPDEAYQRYETDYILADGRFPSPGEAWQAAIAYAAGVAKEIGDTQPDDICGPDWHTEMGDGYGRAARDIADRLSPPATN